MGISLKVFKYIAMMFKQHNPEGAIMGYIHPYIPNSEDVKKTMLDELGLKNIDDLFSDIPEKFRLKRPLNIPYIKSEYEIYKHILNILSKNKVYSNGKNFIGAGAYEHYIPAVVKALSTRGEFVTAYTPYQPEISQGMLQTLYEYQSLIAELFEMDIVNASMYDMASALAEAVLMTARVTHRKKFIIPENINPQHVETLFTYTEPHDIEIVKIPYDPQTGMISVDALKKAIDQNTAGVYIQNPNYFGVLEEQVDEIEQIVHANKSMFVVGVDPISLGIIRAPGNYGADIAIAEGQTLGAPMSFGGPQLGIFAVKDDKKYQRQLPGRLIGLTTTKDGNEIAFVMTLQPREQHIRRERATSNICSNEALMAVIAAMYIATLGKTGITKLAETIATNTAYAMKKLGEIKGVKVPVFEGFHFQEFVINFDKTEKKVDEILEKMHAKGILGGLDISSEFDIGQSALVYISEVHTKEDIDNYVEIVKEAIK